MDLATLSECFDDLASETRDFCIDASVPYIDGPPSAVEFLRKWVCPNKPVVFRNAISHWKALHSWSHDYLRSKLHDVKVTVAVTPNGYADAVNGGQFVLPEERSLTFPEFLDVIECKKEENGIFYVQKQNSNFTDEFNMLMQDAEAELPWATEAFGSSPDAVNFWMGDERAVTSMHRDHYENLYCVVRGSKTFTLIPPAEQPFVPYEMFPVAEYKEESPCHWKVIPQVDSPEVPWIPVDPLCPDYEKYPLYRKAQPLTVTVHEGETLYLPSLWFHHVQQSHGCIAVNFWYDMEYDLKYCYYKFTEKLIKQSKYHRTKSECTKIEKTGEIEPIPLKS